MSNDPVGFLEHVSGLQGPQGFNRYAYANNNPYKYIDPDGEIVQAAPAFVAGTLTCGLNNSSDKPEAHEPRSLTEEEKKELSDAGKAPDKGKRTKAGRAGEKHGSRPGSAFPPTSGNPDSINDQGQGVLDGILNNPESTKEVDGRGRTTVTAPDGRGARYNPDGSLQGFREPE